MAPLGPESRGSEATPVELPALLGRYHRDRRLGRGGMGVVWRYRDPRLDRYVAVKALPAHWAADPGWRMRMEREAQVLASLSHHNIAAVYDVMEQQGQVYLLLEYVAGQTLSELLRGGSLGVDRSIAIGHQLALAIEAGHAHGVVHRDIKPSNIMIGRGDRAKLLDYGLAMGGWPSEATTDPHASGGASGGMFRPASHPGAGTPGYMSPEQIEGARIDRRVDVFAFGCVVYECLTGCPAFPGASAAQRIEATLKLEPDLARIPTGTPADLRDLLARCLHKDAAERLSDIGVAARELGRRRDDTAADTSTRPVPHNLPAPLTSFVGRAAELDALGSLLEGTRLLTITGPGGCGKTRLALELGRRHATRGPAPTFPDGVWVVELAAVESGDLVGAVVASALRGPGGPLANRQLPVGTIAAALRDQRLLLMLDNCEHVAEAAGRLAQQVLTSCAGVRVLATSRSTLGVSGEQVFVVPPLPCPPEDGTFRSAADFEAVRLFLDRASLARPGFALDRRCGAAVVDICRRLEGMPLPIELAAARLRAMGVVEVAERLADVLDPERVIESSIQWSIQLLGGAERSLLARLSVFRGGWTLEAAEAICGDDGGSRVGDAPLIQVLGRLVERSLVIHEEREERTRYRLLEAVRGHVAGSLPDPPDAARLRRAQLAHFLDLAVQADAASGGPEHAAWLARLDVERHNLHGALEWSIVDEPSREAGARLAKALHPFWQARGLSEQARAWLDVFARARTARDVLQAQILNGLASIPPSSATTRAPSTRTSGPWRSCASWVTSAARPGF
jgi:non-specific serine/threonine protein kinase